MRYTIPTTFTAIDQMSRPIAAMGSSLHGLQLHAAQAQRSFNGLAPSISSTSKRMIEFAKDAAVAGIALFAGNGIMDYETAVASFRTIVSDLNDTDFAPFENKIANVAEQTRRSTVDVANSFEMIAGLNSDFAKTADGLGLVSTAAITMAKAANMDLQPASQSLVGTMNQFSLGAEQANKVINALAAGQAVGAASISLTAESLTNFGKQASDANITVEQSIGLVQTLAKFGQMGADAGDKLKTSLIRIQQAGVGYKSGIFNINDALYEMKNQVNALATEQEKDAYITDKFGAFQIATGRILLGNIPLFNQFTASVTGTTEAEKAAEIQSNTLANRVKELGARFITLVTTSGSVGFGLNLVKRIVVLVTDNLGLLLAIVVPIAGAFLIWKGYIIGVQGAIWLMEAATWAYNLALGVMIGLQDGAILSLGISTTAIKAYNVVTWLSSAAINVATVATWAWAAAINFGIWPITLIVIGVIALIAVIVQIVKHIKGWGELWSSTMAFMKNAFMVAFYYPIKLYLLAMQEAWMILFDAIVLAWNWAMNKVHLITDKQYEKEKNQIKDLHAARIGNIKATVKEWGAASVEMGMQKDKITNSLHWGNEKEMNEGNAETINSSSSTYKETRHVQELIVKAEPGTSATLGRGSGDMPEVFQTGRLAKIAG